jgi:Abnormal spindle-like microcephaly-assoc'd, ASPM-SPD-2-Hydin
MKRAVPFLCLCAWLAPGARAQFAFSVVNGTTMTPVATSYNFGDVSPGMLASASFQLQNTSTAAANLTFLNVAGTGFSISSGPTLPQSLNPQAVVTFTVNFQGTVAGGYSAFLLADGVTALLTAAVVPGLTYQVETASGKENLGAAAAINFGAVNLGQTSWLQFSANNTTGQPLTVPAITVSGTDFSLSVPVSTTTLQPGGQASFAVQFQPSAAGTRSGTVTIGSNSYALTGTGIAAVLPQPHVNILLSQAQSAQQGTVTVTFDSPAATSGSGTLTLEFQPAVSGAEDSAIAFASGGQSVPFTFSAGDVQATFGAANTVGFQTGTTAGTIQFTAAAGSLSDEQSVTIVPATVSFTNTQANRYSGSVVVEIAGFDNTRSAGALSFAFYDAGGNLIAPGAISTNATTAFAQYFSASEGGGFLLNATFPVAGDASQITYVQAAFTNSAGTSTTVRTALE